MNAIIFDVEWANGKNKSICQLAFLEIDLSNMEILYEFNEYINPLDHYDHHCVAVHGINDIKTKECRNFMNVWGDIKDYFKYDIVIGHNVCSADLDALTKNLKRFDLDIPQLSYVDTLDLSKMLIPHCEVPNYKLSTLANYYQIDVTNAHDALSDVHTTLKLLQKLMLDAEFPVTELIDKYESCKECFEFTHLISKKEYVRELTKFAGVISGVEMDKIINDEEVSFIISWKDKYKDIRNKRLSSLLEDILEDGIITMEECDLLRNYLLNELVRYSHCEETSGLLLLNGIIDGITADNAINDDEVRSLQLWLYNHQSLEGNYPYDRIFETVNSILEDGIITDDEKKELTNVFKEFFHPLENAKKILVEFSNKNFVLSGNFNYGSKADVEKYIINKGGIIQKGVTKKTDYVVVGGLGSDNYSQGSYGTKVKKALELNKTVLKEEDLFIE